MRGLQIIAGLGAAVILTACGSSAANQGPAAPPSGTSASSGTAAGGGNGSTTGNGNGVDGPNSGGTPAGAGDKPKKGVISGVLEMIGGAIGTGDNQVDPRPVAGTVTFISLRHGTFTTQADSHGQFSMKLPVGSYHLTGRTANEEALCHRPAAVNVTVDDNVHVEVNCITP